MRLICPNCGAQYDVDDDVVPEGGRDVQCSNCGHTWFQRPTHKDKELAEELDEPTTAETLEDEEDTSLVPQDAEIEAESEADSDADQDEEPEAGEDTEEPEPPQQRELEAGVADILRQEAERESSERVAEGSSLETQPDLGLSDGDEDSAAAKERMARMRGLGDEDLGAAAVAGARKDLLPDIEEINSTLTASSDRDGDETAGEYQGKRRRSGFRRGFSIAALIFALMALFYVFAPKIVEMYPAAESSMNAYVEWVNRLRVTVDGLMQSAVEKLTALLSQLNGSGGDS